MESKKIYRGYKKIFLAFTNAKKNDRLLHAYGFIGRHKSGKGNLVRMLAEDLLDLAPNSRIHPDLHEYVCDDAENSIDSLRQFLTDFQGTPILAKRRIAILYALDALSGQEQNSLLKTLEEPPKNHLLLCTLSSKKNVLPTIASRLTCIELPKIPMTEVIGLPHADDDMTMVNMAYDGGVERFDHISKERLLLLHKVQQSIAGLTGAERWKTIESLFSGTQTITQLKDELQTWFPLLRHQLISSVDDEDRKKVSKIIEGFGRAYASTNLTTARLSIEKSLL